MTKNILAGLLLISFLQTECANNVHQSRLYQNDESINLIDDEITVADSVYNLCTEKFANLIRHPNEKQFLEIITDLNFADKYPESLLYNLVAADKFGFETAKSGIACCVTQSLSSPNMGKNSKDMALFYLKNGEFSIKFKRGKQIIDTLESLSTDITEIIVPKITNKSTEIQRLKASSLKGSVEDYKKLKEIMSTDEMYAFMLYYSYVMADRYGYEPAKKDVVDIIDRFYKEYNLEPIDKDTKYFCSFFK
jgi:hypothetical protein